MKRLTNGGIKMTRGNQFVFYVYLFVVVSIIILSFFLYRGESRSERFVYFCEGGIQYISRLGDGAAFAPVFNGDGTIKTCEGDTKR